MAKSVETCEPSVVRKEPNGEVYQRYFRNKPMGAEKFTRLRFGGNACKTIRLCV